MKEQAENRKIELIASFKLDATSKKQIAALVAECFPEVNFHGRTYFKQLPHYRLLLKQQQKIIGQMGLDYRVMTLNEKPIKVLGIIDLTVLPAYQGQGLGTKLLKALDDRVQEYLPNVDFLFLSADEHRLYENCGYTLTKNKVKWLGIDNHNNYGILEEMVADCLMYKQVGEIVWQENVVLDMLGYWY